MSFQPLYLITDGGALRKQGLLLPRIVEILSAAHGQVAYVQLREQVEGDSGSEPASDREVLRLVEQLLPLCHQYQAKLIINRRPDLVLTSGADGVHLGVNSLSLSDTFLLLNGEQEIGYSAHSVEEGVVAANAGAHYLFLSPIFPPRSKTTFRTPLASESLSSLSTQTTCPVYALGGIAVENVGTCRIAGARGVAVISSLLLSDNPRQATKALVDAWNGPLDSIPQKG